MASASRALKAAIPLCVLLLACVEQDEEKPTAEDLATAKQNILTTPPTPQYAGQRRPRRQAGLPRSGRRPRSDRAGQGRHADALLEAGLVAGAGLEDVHAPQRRRQQELHQRRSRAREGQVPGQRVEDGRDHPRPAHRSPAGRLGGAVGRGLRRPVARGDAHDGQGRPARRGGARARRDDSGEHQARRRGGRGSATSPAW